MARRNSPPRRASAWSYVLARAQEASTVRGLVLLVTGFLGVALTPDQHDAIVSAGVALAGVAGVFLPDRLAS
ncbi:MAG: hypothetical protein EPN21_06260 [Methylococcaceae bacterium]|nr:MAG: hypothetical protein EPN21_06260 [Methylococcaceae bacterium]